jgi:hypothetical protein
MKDKVVPIRETRVIPYKGYEVTLRYRADTNDWAFSFRHTATLIVDGHGRSYESALIAAKRRADILTGNTHGPAAIVHRPSDPGKDDR